ncbi:hypothetical protein Droror1_Dr00026638 [Drosera rotundifolia]
MVALNPSLDLEREIPATFSRGTDPHHFGFWEHSGFQFYFFSLVVVTIFRYSGGVGWHCSTATGGGSVKLLATQNLCPDSDSFGALEWLAIWVKRGYHPRSSVLLYL